MKEEEIENIHALIVDDDAFMQDLISATLGSIGVGGVKTAGSGPEALEILKSGEPGCDLIMCDLYMPDMDGIEFLDHVNKIGFDGSVILFSGVSRKMLKQAEELAATKNVKILGCLEKPINREDLKDLLCRGEDA